MPSSVSVREDGTTYSDLDDTHVILTKEDYVEILDRLDVLEGAVIRLTEWWRSQQ